MSQGLLSGLVFPARMNVSFVCCPWNSHHVMIRCFASDEWVFFVKDPHCHFHSSSEIERPQCFNHVNEVPSSPTQCSNIISVSSIEKSRANRNLSFIPEGHMLCRGPPSSLTQEATRAAVQILSTTDLFCQTAR